MRMRRLLAMALAGGLVAAGTGLFWLQAQGVAPRALAPYLAKRSSGHNPLIEGSGAVVARTLLVLDRGEGLLPGAYRVRGSSLRAARPGQPGLPVTLRAAVPGSVLLELQTTVGFKVSAPHWRFENLALRGVCASDSSCGHAFQVVGAATHFVAINNIVTDVNAAFKINSEGGRPPPTTG